MAEDDKVLAQMHRLLDGKHSTQLVSLIDKILKKVRLPLKKLDGFCINKGPGSFTGLRIGITTIKGLAFVLQKPVVAIPSLDILTQNARPVINRRFYNGVKKIKAEKGKGRPLQVCPIVDAKQNKVYACLYQSKNGKIVRKSGYLLLPVEELLKKIEGEVIFLGDAIPLYREVICANRRIKPAFAEEKFWCPRASAAVPLALEYFRRGKFEDINRLTPLYLYPKECQIKQRK